MTRFAALIALQSHVIYIYRTDGSRILVELCKKFRSISIGITVGKAVGITYLVTRKAFIFAQLRRRLRSRNRTWPCAIHLHQQEFSKYFDPNYGWICRWPRLFGDKKCVFFCSATRTSSITKSHLVPYIFIGRSLPKQVFYCRITDYCVVMSNFFLHMELTYFKASTQCISSLLSWFSLENMLLEQFFGYLICFFSFKTALFTLMLIKLRQ